MSHARTDTAVATRLVDWLRNNGFHSVFLDTDPVDGITAGASWEQVLYKKLRGANALVAIVSAHYTASQWCMAELAHARTTGKPVLGLRIDGSSIPMLLSSEQVLDIQTDAELTFARLKQGLLTKGVHGRLGGAWNRTRSPYPGLLSFDEKDAPVFFGREPAVQKTVEALRGILNRASTRFLTILGASGAGKSSLLRAGVLPALRKDPEAWLILPPIIPGKRPFTELAKSIALHPALVNRHLDFVELRGALQAGTETALLDWGERLRVAAGHPQARVVLVVDQLEELLEQRPDTPASTPDAESQSAFLSLLARASRVEASPFVVLTTLRSDFLGELQKHPAAADLDFSDVKLGPMTTAELVQVIEGPASVAGLELEAGLTELLVRDTEGQDALPLLAFTLRELFERYGQDGLLEKQEYEAGLGGMQKAISDAAEAVIARSMPTDAQLEHLRRGFLRLVRLAEDKHVRRRAAWDELPPSLHDLFEKFVQARLLVSRATEETRELEVAHEALFRAWSRLATWLKAEREFLSWRTRLDEHRQRWVQAKDKQAEKDALLTGAALSDALAKSGQYSDVLTAEERAFIDASARAAATRRRVSYALVGLVVATLAIAAGVAYRSQLAAEASAKRAKRAALVAAARDAAATDPARAAAFLREVGKESPPAGWRPLLGELNGANKALKIDRIGRVRPVFLRQPQALAFGSLQGALKILDVVTGETHTFPGHTQAITQLTVLRGSGNRLLSSSDDGSARVWSIKLPNGPSTTGTVGASSTVLNHGQPITIASSDDSGRHVVTVASDGSVKLWDTMRPLSPTNLSASPSLVQEGFQLNQLAVAADGSWISARLPQEGDEEPLACTSAIAIWRSGQTGFQTVSTSGCALSQDGSRYAVLVGDIVRVFSIGANAVPFETTVGDIGHLYDVGLSPAGNALFVLSGETIKAWYLPQRQPALTLTTKGSRHFFSEDEMTFVTHSTASNNILVGVVSRGKPGHLLVGHPEADVPHEGFADVRVDESLWYTVDAEVTRDSSHLLTRGFYSGCHLFRLDGTPISLDLPANPNDQRAEHCGASHDGGTIFASLGDNVDGPGRTTHNVLYVTRSDTLTRARSNQPAPRQHSLLVLGDDPQPAAAKPDDKKAVSPNGKISVRLENAVATVEFQGGRSIEVEMAEPLSELPRELGAYAFSADSTRVALAGPNGKVFVIDASGSVSSFQAHLGNAAAALALNANGKVLLSMAEEGVRVTSPVIQVWDMTRVPPDATLLRAPSSCYTADHLPSFLLSDDGAKAFLLKSDTQACVWDVGASPDAIVLPRALSLALSKDQTAMLLERSPGTVTRWPFSSVLQDVQTSFWTDVPYCVPAEDRTALLGEDEEQANSANQRCVDTMLHCQRSTFDECAHLVAREYP